MPESICDMPSSGIFSNTGRHKNFTLEEAEMGLGNDVKHALVTCQQYQEVRLP